jgi:Mor family transcriptional regulator
VILDINMFPVDVPVALRTNHKISQELWPEVVEQSEVKTYRELANEYEVSYEAIRRVINATSSH